MNDPNLNNGGAAKKQRKLRTYPGLGARDFMHPWDVKATAALHRVPGFDRLIAKVMEYGLERILYLENIADNVRVTEKMFPRLYRYLKWSCAILGVEEPEMYVSLDPVPNAYTYGHTRPFIVLTSGLVDVLGEQEQFFAVAHEVGHVKCEHSLYTTVARNIAAVIEIFSQATLGLGSLLGKGIELPLYDWMRRSELSADRAALLCVQDKDVAIRTFMKLAGGAQKLYAEMDQDEFLRQIRAYEEADESTLNKVYKFLITAMRTHPFPILRAKHLDEWITSGDYDKLARTAGAD
ncbi:Peptidase family M48 [Nannocystis exedens]|uniref:Peptidase family M48 n=1 Tax=Nannocystis exedens TaxID=54 RepID=A0A1I2CEX9_9BACT|nr:M48 family metallopeptidase [Nannocystis exedens]PCC68328.1 peptidase M48 [Nannocystis exedens]SFE66927.1 Peptidase family M48 [Nannocystis exedens]